MRQYFFTQIEKELSKANYRKHPTGILTPSEKHRTIPLDASTVEKSIQEKCVKTEEILRAPLITKTFARYDIKSLDQMPSEQMTSKIQRKTTSALDEINKNDNENADLCKIALLENIEKSLSKITFDTEKNMIYPKCPVAILTPELHQIETKAYPIIHPKHSLHIEVNEE